MALTKIGSTGLGTDSVNYDNMNANTAFLDRSGTFSAPQRSSVVDLGVRTGPATTNTVTIDMNSGNHFKLTSNANILFANPSNMAVGQGGTIVLTSNGAFTVTWGSYWRFSGGIVPSFSTTTGAQDKIDYFVYSANTIYTTASLDMLGT